MKKIKIIIKIVFILFAFFIIFHKIDIEEIKHIKLQKPIFLFFSFLLYNLSQIVSTLRVHSYLKNVKVTPNFKKQLILYYVGMFYNTLLPGGVGGDAYKAYKFQKSYNQGYKKIIKALLIDRINGLFAIITLCAVLLLFSSFEKFYFFLILCIIFVPFILYFIHHILFFEFKKDFFKTFFYSLIIQTLQLLTFVCVLISLGVNKNILEYGILFFVSSVISVIPITVGGVGLRELTFLYGAQTFHLNATMGVIAGFLFFLINVVSSAIGALFLKGVENV